MLVIYNDLNPSSNSISYKRLNKPKAGPGLGPTGQKQTFVPDQTAPNSKGIPCKNESRFNTCFENQIKWVTVDIMICP
jgi:hypothetical protein